jgi:hypothetical protein
VDGKDIATVAIHADGVAGTSRLGTRGTELGVRAVPLFPIVLVERIRKVRYRDDREYLVRDEYLIGLTITNGYVGQRYIDLMNLVNFWLWHLKNAP